jgi:tripartite-type tricarboxylate transporter receptor subunit TctC
MKVPRRTFLQLAAGAAALPAISRVAGAQTYPMRPVRIIVFAAGGPTDIVARLMAQWLSEHLGQEFVVENRPGAASNIGTEAALRAPPDGYTLLLVTSTNAVNVTFYENLNFNFMTDIAPVVMAKGVLVPRNPMVGSFCCARATSGQAAAPPTVTINSRRLMVSSNR